MNRKFILATLALSFTAGCQSPLTSPASGLASPTSLGVDPAPAATAPLPPQQAAAPAAERTLMATAGLTATASVAAPNYAAARAVDASSDTEWQSGPVATSALTLDRGATGALTALGLKVNPGPTYAVSVSTDAATWKAVLTGQKNTTWGAERKALPSGTKARYVRLDFTNGGKNAMVFDVTTEGSLDSVYPSAAPTAAPSQAPTAAPTAAPTVPPATTSAFVATRFGNQSVPRGTDGTHARGYQLISELGMNTIREGWNWANLQPAANGYVSWLGAYTDPKTTQLANLGLKTQAMVCDTPAWATSDTKAIDKRYAVPNGLAQSIFADGTDVYKAGAKPNPNNKFAVYMFDMVSRYKGQVSSWQVWNEPDFPSGDLGAGYKGSTNGWTRYWNGSVQDYVRLLRVAHTVVKGVDPAARITLGGLGYESYLAAIIDNGGAPYFDVVDFHAYGTDKTSANGVLNSAWGFLGRYNAMKNVLKAKGVTGKTLACSETGMTADKPEEQAGYAAKVMATGLGLGDVEMVQWAVFTNPGHLNIGLVDKGLTTKTAGYKAYAFTTKQLAGAKPAGAVTGTGVQGWRFQNAAGKSMWLVWASGASASFALPGVSGQVVDKYGATRASYAGGNLALTADPVWVVSN